MSQNPHYRAYLRAIKREHAARTRKGLDHRATPAWADQDELIEVYLHCPDDMYVDHIVPLNGALVCGLHCPANLQYLTPLDNHFKGSILDPTKHVEPPPYLVKEFAEARVAAARKLSGLPKLWHCRPAPKVTYAGKLVAYLAALPPGEYAAPAVRKALGASTSIWELMMRAIRGNLPRRSGTYIELPNRLAAIGVTVHHQRGGRQPFSVFIKR